MENSIASLAPIAECLGFSAAYFARCQAPQGEHFCAEDFIPFGDETQPSVDDTTSRNIKTIIKNYPKLAEAVREQFGANASADAEARLAAASATEPGFAKIARDIAVENARTESGARANIDKGLLEGEGADIVRLVDSLSREIDPEFFSTRSKAAAGISDLLGPISGGEIESIKRGMAREDRGAGNINPSNLDTISHGMTFGQAGRDRMSQALALANNLLPVSRTGADPLMQATKTPSSLAGAFNTSGVKAGLGDLTFGTANNLIGDTGETSRATEVNKLNTRSASEKLMEAY